MNHHDHHGADLSLRALLYACGDMDPDDAGAFEALLADDQEARDALVTATELLRAARGLGPAAPNPGYRAAVRARLFRGVRPAARRLTRERLTWGLAGALAASLLFVAVSPPWRDDHDGEDARPTPAAKADPDVVHVATTAEALYSDLSNFDRLERIRAEHLHRRARSEEPKMNHPALRPAGLSSGKAM
jgi:hypothetical protein